MSETRIWKNKHIQIAEESNSFTFCIESVYSSRDLLFMFTFLIVLVIMKHNMSRFCKSNLYEIISRSCESSFYSFYPQKEKNLAFLILNILILL